ncbi:uncharacterized protein LOC129757872 [Uranotaenia lowii]|uniref:uncharacterized protein LOC129757872 n=1 Tax=Uranotaenia lowii TaxID=190385 RepID=UPI002479ECB7|nr:uncharacterized protein LOC129757872 [Uranotaenia lowii]
MAGVRLPLLDENVDGIVPWDEEDEDFKLLTDIEAAADTDMEIDRGAREMEREHESLMFTDNESLPETVSSDMSMDGIVLDSDDEDALEEYSIYQEAKKIKKQAEAETQEQEAIENGNFHTGESEPEKDLDAINRRYLGKGNVSQKPQTMTSASGELAILNLRRPILPAKQLLCNYLKRMEQGPLQGENPKQSKENINSQLKMSSSNLAVDTILAPSKRRALCEKNGK